MPNENQSHQLLILRKFVAKVSFIPDGHIKDKIDQV